ncbi:MFS transporter [Ferrovum sp.]|uniref:MFS transporter n=1 Tax=Ferrovum sp. TaxID=2609467 RepID=UPI002624EF47|nr:MFS transporter [Ferrovum sp.]
MFKIAGCSRFLTPTQFILFNLTLGIGHFLVLLNAGAYLPMLPYVTGSMDEGLPYVVWGQSDYFTALGSAFLIARPLMKRFGPKVIAIASYLLFSFASLGTLFVVHDLILFTGFRVIQGFAAGLSVIPSFFLLLEYYKTEHQHTATSLWGLAVFIPFSVGPALGGWLAYVLGDWRLLFFASFLISLLIAGILWGLLADWEDVVDRSYPLFDQSLTFGLFFASALMLQEFFDVGLLSDLSSRFRELWGILFLTLIGFASFQIRNARSETPLLDLALFSHRNFGAGTLLFCLSFMLLQGGIVQYIIRFQLVEGYTPWHVGLLFLPLFIFSKPFSLLTQRLIQNGWDPRIPASLSLLAIALDFWWISSYLRPATWELLLLPQLLLGAAIGPFFSSMTTLALGHVPKNQQLHALDLLNGARNMGAGLAITFSDIGWDRLQALQWNLFTTPDPSNSLRFLSFSQIEPHRLHTELERVSGYLTLNDFFQLLAWGGVLFSGLVWFLTPPQAHLPDPDLIILENLGEEP